MQHKATAFYWRKPLITIGFMAMQHRPGQAKNPCRPGQTARAFGMESHGEGVHKPVAQGMSASESDKIYIQNEGQKVKF